MHFRHYVHFRERGYLLKAGPALAGQIQYSGVLLKPVNHLVQQMDTLVLRLLQRFLQRSVILLCGRPGEQEAGERAVKCG